MISIKQTNFNGIDGLEYVDEPIPKLNPDSVIIEMDTLPVVPTDIKKERDPNATSESFSKLPRTIGVSGVGTVVEVGSNRDAKLDNKRVFVLNPSGSYSEYIRSENPDWLFVLPDSLSNEAAATLTATPLVLKNAIDNCHAKNVVITGANSVIGIYLLELLNVNTKNIYPLVRANSKSYLKSVLPMIKSYTLEELPNFTDDTQIIDIAGSMGLIEKIVTKSIDYSIVSIAIMKQSKFNHFKFVHEKFSHQIYDDLIQKLSNEKLKAPIDKIFRHQDIKTAQHYLDDNPSRGRVLMKFN